MPQEDQNTFINDHASLLPPQSVFSVSSSGELGSNPEEEDPAGWCALLLLVSGQALFLVEEYRAA